MDNSTTWPAVLADDRWTDILGWDCAPCRYASNRENDASRGAWQYNVMLARVALFILFEHVVFTFKFLAHNSIATEPRMINRLARVQEYVADHLSEDDDDDDDNRRSQITFRKNAHDSSRNSPSQASSRQQGTPRNSFPKKMDLDLPSELSARSSSVVAYPDEPTSTTTAITSQNGHRITVGNVAPGPTQGKFGIRSKVTAL